MIGLEYIIKLHGKSYTELANELGIKKQNITCWLSGKQSVSKKHLPALSKIFNVPEKFFQKELTYSDEVEIQELFHLKNTLQFEGIPSKEEAPLALQMRWEEYVDYRKGNYRSLYVEILKGVNAFTKLANLSEESAEKKIEAAFNLEALYAEFIIFIEIMASTGFPPEQESFDRLTDPINRFIDSVRELDIPYEKMLQDKDN